MSIYDKARELGELILSTEESKRLSDARNAFDNDEEAQKVLFDYTNYRENLQLQIETGAADKQEFKDATKILNEKIQEVKKHPIINEMIKAENDFNSIINQVVDILKATATGESPSGGCSSGGCSGCKGCH